MQLPPFKATVRKSGNSNIITIPSDFVEQGYMAIGKQYMFEIKEVDTNGEGQTN